MFEGLLQGLLTVIEPFHLLMLILAVVIGFLGGAMPGISGAMLVVILLPITYGMESVPAFLLLTSIYAAAVFSGMITAILFRTPGTPEAVATVFDGYPMAQKGQAGRALGIGILSSSLGGIIGTLFLIFLTPVLANVALQFSSAEYFALAVLGLTVVASLSGGDLIRGGIGVLIGLFVATVGIDPISGTHRFTFGSIELQSGIQLVPVLIGLFAIPEVLKKARESTEVKEKIERFRTKIFEWSFFKRIYKTIARSSLLGVFIGILPGIGATTASMVSYGEAVRWSKTPEKFGTGVPEGIAAPESANNSAAMGAMVPLLSLGIPGSATTAVILGAFVLHGLQPGPMLFTMQPELVYTIFVGLLIVNVSILFLAKPFISAFSHTVKIPYSIMGPLIIIFCFIGTFAVRNSMVDVLVMFISGLIGYYFEKIKFPVVTIILGIVLGPMAEEEFRRALQIANGDVTVFLTRPISVTLLALAVIVLLFPLYKEYISGKKKKDATMS